MDDCMQAAANSGMFALCSEPTLRQICARAKAVTYPKNAVVYHQGETQTEMLLPGLRAASRAPRSSTARSTRST